MGVENYLVGVIYKDQKGYLAVAKTGSQEEFTTQANTWGYTVPDGELLEYEAQSLGVTLHLPRGPHCTICDIAADLRIGIKGIHVHMGDPQLATLPVSNPENVIKRLQQALAGEERVA